MLVLHSESGSVFHVFGPYNLNAHDANIFLFVLGTSKMFSMFPDLNPCLLCCLMVINLLRYAGAMSWRDLNMRVHTL